MKHFTVTTFVFAFLCAHLAVSQGVTAPPSGDNQKSVVTQYIGSLAHVTITYNSPNVTGPGGEDRTGHIWGELVPYGMAPNSFGSAKEMPWRAGSNENTTVTFSHGMEVEGQPIAAGTYGLHMIPKENEPWTIIFSNNSNSWGSYFYDESEDAIRVTVEPQESEFTEWLTYEFIDRQPDHTVVALKWENLMITISIAVPDVKALYVEKMRDELESSPGFNYQTWATAAMYCAQNDVNLDEALTWADNAISMPFIGRETFGTLQTKATVLMKLDREAEADEVMMKAIHHPTADVQQIHAYARTLIAANKPEKAMEVFQLNKKMHPEDVFTTSVGLARGYAALGDTKKAIKQWEIALENIPEEQKPNLPFYQSEIKKLKGEDEGEVGK